ncbi:Hypothetical Protein FCC1311_071262 [Hondaea fermentalgiana]|uniref:DASH complex subunit DAD2 n=1 Tax=Hondaea fermentalgiana TaxID=2315210 RepID=A0A2R5GJV1_9STRA|nr:Hypothetical Protein FCC1311_071262 [Hondaea fermentalgiana]|eukprot:GBG30905.1 Hypothetical Protein FCC1311_071262 [Hondaea fermentalgiana]
MDEDQVELLAELRALQFTVDKIVVALRKLREMTEPGGGFYEAQKRAAESMRIWDTLFQAARDAEENKETGATDMNDQDE